MDAKTLTIILTAAAGLASNWMQHVERMHEIELRVLAETDARWTQEALEYALEE